MKRTQSALRDRQICTSVRSSKNGILSANFRKILCLFLLAVLSSLFSVNTAEAATGSLKVFSKNESGVIVSGKTLKLYDSAWAILGTVATNASGYYQWDNLTTGTYNVELYDANGDFWGSATGSITAGTPSSPTTWNVQRTQPRLDSTSILFTPSIVTTGQNVHLDFTVLNGAAFPQNAQLELWIDRDKAASWDAYELKTPVSITANGSGYFGKDYTPTSTGTYYLRIVVKSNPGGNYVSTDTHGWEWSFSVNAPPVNGVCGSSNGSTFTTKPTSNLCSSGNATTVNGSGPWTWQCAGSNGGTTASCSANIQYWTVSTSAGIGGTLSPVSQSVKHGSNTSFTISPNTGYTISAASGCGGSLSGSTYTTGAITAACTVSASFSSVGSLKVYSKNTDGITLLPGKTLKLYNASWSLQGTVTTNASSYYQWDNLTPGTYYIELYDANGDFWGGASGNVAAGSSSSPTIWNAVRTHPWLDTSSIAFTPGTTVTVGQQINIDFAVKNGGGAARNAQVEVWIDRDQASPWDAYELKTPVSIAADGTAYFGKAFTPTVAGTYSVKIVVKSDPNATYIPTDTHGWEWSFTVNEPSCSVSSVTTLVNGGTAPFTVDPSSRITLTGTFSGTGNGPITYHWEEQLNGGPWTSLGDETATLSNGSGFAAAKLTTPSAGAIHTYRVAVTSPNSLVSANSLAATIKPVTNYGTTVITHGYQPGGYLLGLPVPDWTINMGCAILDRAKQGGLYIYSKSTGAFVLQPNLCPTPMTPGSGESVLIYDWVEDSNIGNRGFSEAAGDALFAALMSGSRGATPQFSLTNIHFIGHSRGTVVNSEAVERLIAAGYEVSHVTNLDPHDWGANIAGRGVPDDYDANPTLNNVGIVSWKGVTWSDTYYQNCSIICPVEDYLDGRLVEGTFNTYLGKIGHTKVYEWYLGTIDGTSGLNDWYGYEFDSNWIPSRMESGYRFARLSGLEQERPSIEGAQTTVQFRFDLDGIVNGDISRYPLYVYPLPGWALHGGAGDGNYDNFHLELDSGNTSKTHNRFYIPKNAAKVWFKYKVWSADSGIPGDWLKVSLGNTEIKQFTCDGASIYPILLNQETGDYLFCSFEIPSQFVDSVQTLTFEDVAGGLMVDSEVWIDDVMLGMDDLQFDVDATLVNVPENSTAVFHVKLNAQPSGDVAVSVSRIGGDSDISIQSGSTLVFSPSDWNLYKTVTLSAAVDADAANGEASIQISAPYIMSRTILAKELDSDHLNFETDSSSVSISEGGTASFQVRLNLQPSSDITVSIARVSGDSDITVQSGGIVSFTPSDYGYKTVVLAAAEDTDVLNGSAIIRISADGVPTSDVQVYEVDNDMAPEINIKKGSVSIASGSGVYNFGTELVGVAMAPVSFAIENLGTADLDLTGSPNAVVIGPNASDFVVIQQPATPVVAGSATPFVIRFTPGAEGVRTATVSVQNSDSDEGIYTFTVTGAGVAQLPVSFSVTPSAGAGGSISPGTVQTVVTGASTSFTVSPDTGYTASVGGTCGGFPANSTGDAPFTYTTTAVNADCSVSVTFAPLNTQVALSDAVEQPAWSFLSGGNSNWTGQAAITHDGSDAAQSGMITDGQSSYIETTVNGPGTVNFWWKVSSESGYDFLTFSVDGIAVRNISGEVVWTEVNYAVGGGGSHTLRWEYSKDGSVTNGSDAGWVDTVSFVEGAGLTVATSLYDDFSLGLAGWTLFGNPSPVLVPELHGRTAVFDNMGDPSYNSGAVSTLLVGGAGGFSIESDVYLEFSDLSGCWAGPAIGLSLAANPLFGSYGENEAYGLYFSLEAVGDACWGAPAEVRRHSFFSPGFQAEDGTWDAPASFILNADAYANGWHTLKIDVAADRHVQFLVDGTPLWTSDKKLHPDMMTGRNVVLGVRSSGSAGKAYHDWVRVSPRDVLTDFFEDGEYTNAWVVSVNEGGGSIVETGGALRLYTPHPSANCATKYMRTVQSFPSENLIAEMKFKTLHSGGVVGLDLYQDDTHMVRLTINSNDAPFLEYGTPNAIHIEGSGPYYNADTIFRIVKTGTTYDAYVNGIKKATFTYDGLTSPTLQVQIETIDCSWKSADNDTYVDYVVVQTSGDPAIFSVTPSVGAGGNISPSTVRNALGGSSVGFLVTPNAGYTALVGGTCGGTPTTSTGDAPFVFVTNPVTANCAVSVQFTSIGAVNVAEAVDQASWTFTGGGAAGWIGQLATTHDGTDAAQSGTISHNQESILETTVNGAGTVSFWWMVSSEAGYDFLRFYVDDTPQQVEISGSVGWTQVSVPVTASGSHTLRWVYSKDGSVNAGSDAGWVDQVTWNQDACSDLQLTPSIASYPFSGGSGSFNVIANPACTWTAMSPHAWLSVMEGSGTGNGTVSYIVADNSGAATLPRSGTIIVGSNSSTFVVTQVGTVPTLKLHAPLPTPVFGSATATFNGKIYVIGGDIGTAETDKVQIYDTTNDSWTYGLEKPTAVSLAGAAVIDGKIYVSGGWRSSTGVTQNTLEVYDPVQNAWTSGPAMPGTRAGAGVAAVNGKLYVISGFDGTVNAADTLVYDPLVGAWSTVAPIPTVRDLFGIGVIDGKIYAAGGQSLANNWSSIASLEIYDPAIDAWVSGAPMGAARGLSCSAILGGRLYAIGGYDELWNPRGIERYDPITNTWSSIPEVLNVARELLSAATVGGSIYVLGGLDGNTGTVSNLNESYDTNAAASAKIGIFDKGTWYLDANQTWDWNGNPPDVLGVFGVGLSGAIPVVGDWNGDGKTEIGVFIDGIWYLDMNGNWQWDGEGTDVRGVFGVGIPNAIPVVGDWNGDGKTKIGIYADGIWYLDMNSNWQWDGEGTDVRGVFGVGLANAVPVTGDWNGDGKTEIGIYSEGNWYLDKNQNWAWDGEPTDVYGIFGVGLPNVIPVTGDWGGTGVTKIGVYSDGYWYLDKNQSWAWDGEPADTFGVFGVGLTGVTPVTGNW